MSKHPLLRGNLETIILALLEDKTEMYGYEIVQEVNKVANGTLDIKEGALYPMLHKLEAKGILNTRLATVGNRRRKYYTLTQEGNSYAQEKKTEFQEFAKAMFLILNPKLT